MALEPSTAENAPQESDNEAGVASWISKFKSAAEEGCGRQAEVSTGTGAGSAEGKAATATEGEEPEAAMARSAMALWNRVYRGG